MHEQLKSAENQSTKTCTTSVTADNQSYTTRSLRYKTRHLFNAPRPILQNTPYLQYSPTHLTKHSISPVLPDPPYKTLHISSTPRPTLQNTPYLQYSTTHLTKHSISPVLHDPPYKNPPYKTLYLQYSTTYLTKHSISPILHHLPYKTHHLSSAPRLTSRNISPVLHDQHHKIIIIIFIGRFYTENTLIALMSQVILKKVSKYGV